MIDHLRIGGIQKSLVNLLKEIGEDYIITLYVFNLEGQYLTEIPSSVAIMEAPKVFSLLTLSQKGTIGLGVPYYILRFFLAGVTKLFNYRLPLYLLFKVQKKLKGFDVAISFTQSHYYKEFMAGCNEFVLQRIDSATKLTFLHCDYQQYGGATPYNHHIYMQFDRIAAVSESCRRKFLSVVPELNEKVVTVYNANDYEEIWNLANNNTIRYTKENFIIVTVARLSKEKGILPCVKLFYNLRCLGFKVEWHIVGGGPLYEEIREEIKKYHLEEVIYLYGMQKNPYRYMKNADVFFLPSHHEAAPMVFNDAKFLQIPILTTDTTSAKELVEDFHAGWVCKGEESSLYQALLALVTSPKEVLRVKQELSKLKCSNQLTKQQFAEIVDVSNNK